MFKSKSDAKMPLMGPLNAQELFESPAGKVQKLSKKSN